MGLSLYRKWTRRKGLNRAGCVGATLLFAYGAFFLLAQAISFDARISIAASNRGAMRLKEPMGVASPFPGAFSVSDLK